MSERRKPCRRCFVEDGVVGIDGEWYCLLCMKVRLKEKRQVIKEAMEVLRDE